MARVAKWGLVLVVLTVVAFVVLRWLVQVVSPRPANLGVQDGRLAPCPASPNCVSTLANDELHAIEPIRYSGETAAAHQQLLRLLQNQPRTTLIRTEPTYIYAEFQTPTLGFIDDVEFLFDEPSRLIHFRSASRLGEGDGGLNRRRMEEIRAAFDG